MIPVIFCIGSSWSMAASSRTTMAAPAVVPRVAADELKCDGLEFRAVCIVGSSDACVKAAAMVAGKLASDPKYLPYGQLPPPQPKHSLPKRAGAAQLDVIFPQPGPPPMPWPAAMDMGNYAPMPNFSPGPSYSYFVMPQPSYMPYTMLPAQPLQLNSGWGGGRREGQQRERYATSGSGNQPHYPQLVTLLPPGLPPPGQYHPQFGHQLHVRPSYGMPGRASPH